MPEQEIAQNGRPRALGFATAPIIEAVFAIQPREELQDEELKEAANMLSFHYSNLIEMPFADLSYDAVAATVDVKPNRLTYRFEGEDATELAVLRPDGLYVSQLTPYRSWDDLFKRLRRDYSAVESVFQSKGIGRIACRYINRLDVPFEGAIARNEDYLTVYINVPDSVTATGTFQLRFELPVPEIQSMAVIQSGLMPPFLDGHASFALDIDLVRNIDVNVSSESVFELFSEFREPKNQLYKQFLTPKALDQFQ